MAFSYLKKRNEILGMNSRNLEFVRPCNLRRARQIADDKLLSKRILRKGGLPVPKLIAKISSFEDLEQFDWDSLPLSFALKPVSGFGGEGIIVVYGKKKDGSGWIKADGSVLTIEDIKTHIRNILDGNYSLAGTPDAAFFEERLKLLKLFKPFTYKGIPDIRVIVYNKVPVMAMLRIPTKQSQGKANLTQGAVGVGIDMATGITTTAIQGKGHSLEYAPDTRMLLGGIKIPFWDDILHFAVKAQEISGLGFLGADVAIDKERGPVFVELNARPGLSIQLANGVGLKDRLRRVQGLKIKSAERGVRVGKNLFGGEIEEGVEELSGKRVIGTVEKVKLIGKNGKEVEVEAKIDTGAGFSSIDIDLARQLGFEKVLSDYDLVNFDSEKMKEATPKERWKKFSHIKDLAATGFIHSSHGTSYRPMVNIKIMMDKKTIPAKVTVIERSHLKYSIIIGKRNLGRFLIDTNKNS